MSESFPSPDFSFSSELDSRSSSSSSSEFFASSSSSSSEAAAPIFTLSEQVGWTVFLSVNILVHLAVDVFLIAKRNTKIGRKRFFLYFALCNLGALFFLLDTYGQLWQPDYNFGLAWRWAYAFYVFGFPTMYIPIMLLNFRIITAYKNRHAFLKRKRKATAKAAVTKKENESSAAAAGAAEEENNNNNNKKKKKRKIKCFFYTKQQFKQDWWFIIRFFILLIPFFFVYGFFFYSYDVTYFALSIHLLYMLINMGAVIYLCTIRKLLNRYEIDVAMQMFLIGILFIVYWVLDNLMWNVFIVLLSDSQNYGIIGYSCVKLAMAYIYLVPTVGLSIRDLVRARENVNKGKKDSPEDEDDEEEEEDEDDEHDNNNNNNEKRHKKKCHGSNNKNKNKEASNEEGTAHQATKTSQQGAKEDVTCGTDAEPGSAHYKIAVIVDNGIAEQQSSIIEEAGNHNNHN